MNRKTWKQIIRQMNEGKDQDRRIDRQTGRMVDRLT